MSSERMRFGLQITPEAASGTGSGFTQWQLTCSLNHLYSTVTDLARLRGWSTLQPRSTAMW
jgi:hypothetical protein